ncbi:MAG: chromosome partitioning protein, partial [Roseobacter sp.]
MGTLPPYLNINPDDVVKTLPEEVSTDHFAKISEDCSRGANDLISRGLDESGEKKLRLFSTWEITKYLIPVAPQYFRRVLRANPDLPQGRAETEGGAK